MELEVRPVRLEDATELADLLNQVIARGGTTALEEPFSPQDLAGAYLTGPDVICCFVAIDRVSGRLEGFQTLGAYPGLPEDVGDIGTFARVGSIQRGVGSKLFVATRADNTGGLVFYARQGFTPHGVTAATPLKDGTLVERISKRYRLGSVDGGET